MNSEADNNCDSNSSQVSLLSVQFKKTYIRILGEEIASLKEKTAEINAEHSGWKEKMRTRWAQVKETKCKISGAKTDVKEFKKTRDDVQKCIKDLTEMSELLKSNLNKYRADNIMLEKEHKESIDDMENKWKIYQAQYETLPLAVVRTKEQNRLRRDEVELMVKQYRLAEIEKAVAKQKEIDIKRRNNLVIECAELYRKAKLEDSQMRATLATKKILEEEIIKQEKMIAELTEKQSQEPAAPVKTSNERKLPLLTSSQRRSQPIRRFNLSYPMETLTQPMPTFQKDDFDTISITSSVIDNLIEPEILTNTEVNVYAPGYQNDDLTQDGAVLDSKNNALTVQEDDQIPSNDQKTSNPVINDEEEFSERSEVEPPVDAHFDTQEMDEYDSPNHSVEDKTETQYSLTSEALKKKHGREFLTESNPPPQQLEPGETQMKKPRIMNVEKVQLNITPKKVTHKPLQEDSLARYFAISRESSGDYNWKGANCPSSIFSFQDSQRGNAEFESNIGSEMSMQSEDVMKKFHISFASDRGDKEEYESSMGDNQKQFVTPQASVAEPSKLGRVQVAAAPFIDMVNIGTPNSRGDKKEPFFLSMF